VAESVGLGEGVGLGVGVGDGVGEGFSVGLAVGLAVGVTVGFGEGDGLGVTQLTVIKLPFDAEDSEADVHVIIVCPEHALKITANNNIPIYEALKKYFITHPYQS
jgi:hypothetical protein